MSLAKVAWRTSGASAQDRLLVLSEHDGKLFLVRVGEIQCPECSIYFSKYDWTAMPYMSV